MHTESRNEFDPSQPSSHRRRPPLRQTKKNETRIPVIIIEPDSSVEVGYAMRQNSDGKELPVTETFPTRVPLLRTPTLPDLNEFVVDET